MLHCCSPYHTRFRKHTTVFQEETTVQVETTPKSSILAFHSLVLYFRSDHSLTASLATILCRIDLATKIGDLKEMIDKPVQGRSQSNAALHHLRVLYDEVDAEARRLAEAHGTRLQCRRGCSQCCVDDLTVFDVEAENIRENHSQLLATESPHPSGRCAFLDAEGGCRIYSDRPYVCRTQGLPLRWIDQTVDGEFVELRDICPLNDEGKPIEELDENHCWTIGPVEERLAKLQAEFAQGPVTRSTLRKLFQNREIMLK